MFNITHRRQGMNRKLFKRLEIAGVPIIFTLATLLHGLYDFTGGSIAASLIGAVNESVWEHLKIFALPYIAFAVIEYLWAKPPLRQFVFAKAVSVYVLIAGISAFFYLYTAISKKPILALDISSAIIFTALAQYLSYRLTESRKEFGQYFYIGLMLIALLLFMILCFTFYPPKIDLFKDNVTNSYGIPATALDMGDEVMNMLTE